MSLCNDASLKLVNASRQFYIHTYFSFAFCQIGKIDVYMVLKLSDLSKALFVCT